MLDPAPTSPNLTDHARIPAALRFTTELIAWIATPWALAQHSIALAILSVVVLIGLPTLFSTPGDKKQTLIPVPGIATIALVVLQLVAAVVSVWFAWYPWLAVVVTVLACATVFAELPRWRWLLRAPGGSKG
ncbi:hypothetical protein ACFVUS_05645 [Nocardia sp. NPDC058058]|uniref:hypothetical protein n=1 Tax=Nocardia sp. NPDC058058 TaxID=3346317 RepID=UPI0036DDD795